MNNMNSTCSCRGTFQCKCFLHKHKVQVVLHKQPKRFENMFVQRSNQD